MIQSEIFNVFVYSLIGTAFLFVLLTFLNNQKVLKRIFLSNLYTDVRGRTPRFDLGIDNFLNKLNLFPWGTPRGLGLVPAILLIFFIPYPFNNLVLIIAILAFCDDLIGRRKIYDLPIEWGQLLRGIGMLAIMIVGYPIIGLSAIIIAFLIQPLNIADMQPGSASVVVILMAFLSLAGMILLQTPSMHVLDFIIPPVYIPAILLAACLGYCILDFFGMIMMGEVGNHAFAVALGITFYALGGFWAVLILSFITCCLIVIIRKNNLKVFFARKLKIPYPKFGDYLMDVVTGGGLGDLIRKIIFKDTQLIVKNPILIILGFRRLVYNPYAKNNTLTIRDKYKKSSFFDNYR
ncbi:MAG: cell wall biosynthesis protein [Methanobrevibacter sp.]|nr:cell wall biosynthesis protein [Methanobrevibacter sp.]